LARPVCYFRCYYILQCDVATQLCCGGIFCKNFITNFPQKIAGEKDLKIVQYLAKI